MTGAEEQPTNHPGIPDGCRTAPALAEETRRLTRDEAKAALEARMLNGEPFTLHGLSSTLLPLYPVSGDEVVDQTIQRLRKKGLISYTRSGNARIWKAVQPERSRAAMNDQGHTEGPWKVVDQTAAGQGYMVQSETAHYSQCNVAFGASKRDACLIAAAPDLLKALESLYEAVLRRRPAPSKDAALVGADAALVGACSDALGALAKAGCPR